MTWRNVWARFFLWVARWFGPVSVETPRRLFDKDEQALINLCVLLRQQASSGLDSAWRKVTHDEYQDIRNAQSEDPPADPSLMIYRSASFEFCQDRLEQDTKAKKTAKETLTLRVER